MATRSLGSLTLDLIAKIGGFVSGMTEAERQADKTQRGIAAAAKRRAKETADEWNAATKLITSAFATIGIAGLFSKIIRETIEFERAQTQLAAVLKSTGQAAGFSQQQLNAQAEALGKVIPNTDAITEAQVVLLKFTNIIGDQYVKALELAGDLSARTGEDIKTSAETIGKALNSPAEGLAKLRRFGIDFSDAQRDGLQVLVDTGRAAEAQAVILRELERGYGGAAKAARETFGGSLTALQEALNDLLTGDGDSITSLRDSVESLVTLLKSQEFKDGFANLVGGLVTIIELTAKGITGIVGLAEALGRRLAETFNGASEPLDRLNEKIESLRTNIDALRKGIAGRPENLDWVKESKARIEEFEKELKDAINLRAQLQREAFQPPPRVAAPAGIAGPSKEELEALAARKKAQEEAQKANEAAIKAADAYINRLQDQLSKTQDLSNAEKLLLDIEQGRFKGNSGQRQRALDLAQELDLLKAQRDENEKIVKDFEEQTRAWDKLAAARLKSRDMAQEIVLSQDPAAQLEAQFKQRQRVLAEAAEQDQENALLYAQAAVVLEQQTQEQITRVLEEESARRAALRKAEQDKYLVAAGTFFGALEQLQSSSSEKLARVGRAAAIANTIVKTYESATSAYAALAGIPIVGPALGAAAAAAAIAAGLANVQAIRSQGRAGGGPVSAGNAYEVGEVGRELFVPQQSGFIVPNQMLRKIESDEAQIRNLVEGLDVKKGKDIKQVSTLLEQSSFVSDISRSSTSRDRDVQSLEQVTSAIKRSTMADQMLRTTQIIDDIIRNTTSQDNFFKTSRIQDETLVRLIGHRAGGGPVSAGNEYIVGELGPERFVPQQSGFIVPNQLLNEKGGDGAAVNQRIVNVLDPALVGDFLGTPAGEQVLVNVMRRNSDSIRAVVNNG